jgi:hypothetical protein
MTFPKSVRPAEWVVLIFMGFLWPAAAHAQSSVGSGPLTTTLADTEPTVGILTIGNVRFAPGLTVQEIGWDSNVFDEPPEAGPKEDFVIAVQPDVSMFTRLRFVRISAYAGSELTYYNTYESERSVGHSLRGRVDFLMSRVRPFIGIGELETRTRPNGEIDTRADRQETELSGGLAFDLSPYSLVYASAYQWDTEYENAFENGIDIGQTLTRDAYNYQAGMKTDITPLLSMQLFASYQEDRFPFDPDRNSENWHGNATFRFAPDAVVSGIVTVQYRDMNPVDPGIKPYRGMLGTVSLTYPFMEIGRFGVALSRGLEYSFDSVEAYYLEHSATASYTREVDAQVRGTWASFDYDARESLPSHTDTLNNYGASVGYNLRNRTRIALNYEFARRRSPAFADRNYERRRVYLSWLFAF